MKRLSLLTAFLVVGAAMIQAFAQQANPNRVLVVDTDGDYQSFVIEYEDEAIFKTIEGEVIADVEIYEVQTTEMMVTIMRSPACVSYSLGILPAAVADGMSDLGVVKYVEVDNPQRYYQDFITDPNDPETAARIEGIDLEGNTEYAVLTVGYDEWGIASGVGRFPFKTPGASAKVASKVITDGMVMASDGRVFELPARPSLELK